MGRREKLKKVKGEKKLLVAELRALRDMGLYQGPLTRDGNEFGAATTEAAEQPAKEQSRSQEQAAVVSVPPIGTSKPEESGSGDAQLDLLPYEVMLLELQDRKRVVNSMLKADPGDSFLLSLP
jgi:hypothetical protein